MTGEIRWLQAVLSGFLLLVVLSGLFLTAWTFTRWLDSYLTFRHFDFRFHDLIQEDQRSFKAELILENDGEVQTRIEALHLMLRFDGRLIASERLSPRHLVVEAGESLLLEVNLGSNLEAGLIPSLDSDNRHLWTVRVHLRMIHPVREGVLQLSRERGLTP